MSTTIKKLSKKLITHDGSFHSDDVFACATLCLMLEKAGEEFEIIRTRDPEIIKTGDYVFDIGGIYNAEQNKFDHHQKGGAGKRNEIEYASFGLVWKKFGIEICDNQKVVDVIDQKLAMPIDAFDNGIDLVENKYEVTPYYIQHLFLSMRPTWKEEEKLSKNEMFLKSVDIAKIVLTREITQAQDMISAEELVTSVYENTSDKKIIVLDRNYLGEYISGKFPESFFVIYQRDSDNFWAVRAIRQKSKTFLNKKDFPKAWAGLRDKELQNVTSVPDAVFCHRGLFLAVAKSKEGAIKLAQIAVES